MMEKRKGLLFNAAIYLASFGVAAVPFYAVDDILAASAVFTAVATIAVFIASCALSDVSVYDPYWSVEPPVLLLLAMIKYSLWNVNAFIILGAVTLWAVRLTVNWYVTYKGIGNEDWRYAKYRKKLPAPLFLLVSFFGLHFVPTVVVYLGLVNGLLAIRETSFSPLSLIGLAVMIAAVALEFVSDRAIHGFLRKHKGERRTCDVSVWKYSRHPNYLGEMSFWTGLFLYYAALCPDRWYLGAGFVTIIVLFLVVSIPMMEKHNAERRPDYKEYKDRTSMLFLLPRRK
ncbi:MAG: DUF1295 domain-containing protein [Clostridia bacterium]|nr:DUF1295 domain-containing protein [Clostridia bacterium]